eukprot:TRINITY_DN2733_c2_g2_i1.p1 TRINITY_DN2733_c2_g2~~TRINITY_DN2733_c2_g2_i1.p1  ORF type:complete len:489 (+),score=77.33 TRINITY_DN2733_c2_g2_i1:83-1549(+)
MADAGPTTGRAAMNSPLPPAGPPPPASGPRAARRLSNARIYALAEKTPALPHRLPAALPQRAAPSAELQPRPAAVSSGKRIDYRSMLQEHYEMLARVDRQTAALLGKPLQHWIQQADSPPAVAATVAAHTAPRMDSGRAPRYAPSPLWAGGPSRQLGTTTPSVGAWSLPETILKPAGVVQASAAPPVAQQQQQQGAPHGAAPAAQTAAGCCAAALTAIVAAAPGPGAEENAPPRRGGSAGGAPPAQRSPPLRPVSSTPPPGAPRHCGAAGLPPPPSVLWRAPVAAPLAGAASCPMQLHAAPEDVPPPADPGVLRVVLDMDETLVFARQGPVLQRPGLPELLQALRDMDGVEVVVWTAGMRNYAAAVLRAVDRVSCIRHCVHRGARWFRPDGAKDLGRFRGGGGLGRVLMVENSPECCALQQGNCVIVPSYFSADARDTALCSLRDLVGRLAAAERTTVVSEWLAAESNLRRCRFDTNAGIVSLYTISG